MVTAMQEMCIVKAHVSQKERFDVQTVTSPEAINGLAIRHQIQLVIGLRNMESRNKEAIWQISTVW
jgi:hypothetical protein